MTDRIRHLTITLDEDTRDDDLASIVSAIEHIRGVSSVERHVVKIEDHLARQVVRAEVREKLHDAIESVFRQRELRDKLKER
jgi:hypothetical protein